MTKSDEQNFEKNRKICQKNVKNVKKMSKIKTFLTRKIAQKTAILVKKWAKMAYFEGFLGVFEEKLSQDVNLSLFLLTTHGKIKIYNIYSNMTKFLTN